MIEQASGSCLLADQLTQKVHTYTDRFKYADSKVWFTIISQLLALVSLSFFILAFRRCFNKEDLFFLA